MYSEFALTNKNKSGHQKHCEERKCHSTPHSHSYDPCKGGFHLAYHLDNVKTLLYGTQFPCVDEFPCSIVFTEVNSLNVPLELNGKMFYFKNVTISQILESS
jgi:hypothetical protein